MDREIYEDDSLKCDICHKYGAYDFMGDYICQKCIDKKIKENEDEKRRNLKKN